MSVINGFSEVRPAWLSGASEQNKQRHDHLLQQVRAEENRRDQFLDKAASLKAYAAARSKEWINSALGVSVDPETIKVTCRYTIKVGARTLVQEDKRTFVELALFGVHDRNQRFEMAFEGPVPSGLTPVRVENWLASVNIRSDFWDTRRKAFNDYDVQMALLQVLGARIAYSTFCAAVQGHLNQPNMAMVERFMQGDRSISASAFVMNGFRFGFRDLMVFQQKANPHGNCVLYAPGSPEERDWYQFPNSRELEFHVAGWVRTAEGQSYLAAQTQPAERAPLAKYVATLRQLPSAWKGVTFSEWPDAPEGILVEAIFHQIAWDLAQETLAHPAAYRSAPDEMRQSFARLNTELKALYTIGTREAGILTYERFCYDLIKQRIEDLLKTFGKTVQVNPDEILLDLSENETITLTRLIIKETQFYAHDRGGEVIGIYPRFRVGAKHPALPDLDIRQLASWSRTLRPGENYIAMLRADYLNRQHPDYEFKKDVHFNSRQVEMQRSVLSSFYAGAITLTLAEQLRTLILNFDKGTPASFPPFGEVPSTVQFSAVFKFHVKRCLVEGVYVFRLVQGGKVSEILYTPDAPDGVYLRPLSGFFEAIKEHGLGQYFYDRVKYVDQRIMGTFINNIEFNNVSEKLPVLELNSRVLSLRASYNERIERIIADIDAQTTSLNEIIGKLAYDSVALAASVVSLVIPPVGFALSVVQITKNVLEGAESYRYGDRETAFNSFKEALLDLASLIPGGKEATKAQKTLIQLMGDGKAIVGLIGSATGQTLGHERLLAIIEEILQEEPAGDSKTVLL
ncbi:dermonecrotic toxin domain-containing protein [Pseudomonas sp. RA_15y_Pfl2_54]|uniref:dermonecrotic toxin domain-containing protein n=1 Tax=Pseudomonas sp. RA_15y_Pfl2_54 TaxID=3088704 RepID=UPI0030DD7957